MYVLFSAMLLAALLPAATQREADGPSCAAELRGLTLTTTVELPSRVRVEGPWRLTHSGAWDAASGVQMYRLEAELDRVVQTDELTGQEHEIRLGEPVRLVFEGTDQRDLVRRAARTWCVTVMRAQENRALDQLSPMQPKPIRIASAARAEARG